MPLINVTHRTNDLCRWIIKQRQEISKDKFNFKFYRYPCILEMFTICMCEWTSEATWRCCEPTCLSLESLFDLWPWPTWPLTLIFVFVLSSSDFWSNDVFSSHEWTDRRKAMHKSPPCMSTGGLKNAVLENNIDKLPHCPQFFPVLANLKWNSPVKYGRKSGF